MTCEYSRFLASYVYKRLALPRCLAHLTTELLRFLATTAQFWDGPWLPS